MYIACIHLQISQPYTCSSKFTSKLMYRSKFIMELVHRSKFTIKIVTGQLYW